MPLLVTGALISAFSILSLMLWSGFWAIVVSVAGLGIGHALLRTPVFTMALRITGSNALISIAARYDDTGRLAGDLAEKILIDGVPPPGDLPVARMTNFSFVINMDVARQLDMYPPLDLLRIAETVSK